MQFFKRRAGAKMAVSKPLKEVAQLIKNCLKNKLTPVPNSYIAHALKNKFLHKFKNYQSLSVFDNS